MRIRRGQPGKSRDGFGNDERSAALTMGSDSELDVRSNLPSPSYLSTLPLRSLYTGPLSKVEAP